MVSIRQSLTALTFAITVLATQPLLAERIFSRDLEIRQDTASKCNPNGYKSQNGLNFTTYCGQNNPFNDAQSPFTSPSMSDCMEHCSRYMGNGEGCFGIAWVEANGECWIRNSTTSTASLKKEDGFHSALVVNGEMEGFNTTCPAPDLSVHDFAGVEGLGYTVNCGKIIGGFDACFSGFPRPCDLESPYIGFFHTKTLEECLRICIDQHPLCKAVSWNPGLEIGFANCWPKTGFPETLSAPGAKMGVVHTATITRIDRIDRNCPSSSSYTAQGNKKFDLHCGQLNTGTNITSLHTQNVTACIDACARSDQTCIGVLFDSTLTGGYKNCYLQNTTSIISDQVSATYAALSDSSSRPSTTGAEHSADTSASKAWIAGPVVGGIAALGLIGVAIFWWRRRKNAIVGGVEKDGHAQHNGVPVVSELNGQNNAANELPARMKNAHGARTEPQELPS